MRTNHLTSARLTPLAAALAVALAGCGGAAATTPASSATTTATGGGGAAAAPVQAAAGPIDPCTLVTAQEAEAILGVPLAPATSVKTSCTYAPATGMVPRLNVIAGPGPAGSLRGAFDQARGAATDAADLPGVGEAAFTANSGHQVVFLKGSLLVSLFVAAKEPADYMSKLEAAAKTAAGRIP